MDGRLADDRVDAEHEGGGDGQRAGDVRPGLDADTGLMVEQADGEHRGGNADRDVDEEDPVPVECLGQRASGKQADGAARGGDERVRADRAGLLARVGEHRDDHAEDDGRGHRAADALDEAGRDEHRFVLGEPAGQRRDAEDTEPGEEHPAAPEQVTEPAGQQEQPAERDHVRVDDPGEAGFGEAEVVSDGRQRDVHDRDVENDHQHAGAEDDQGRESAPVGCHGDSPARLSVAGEAGLTQ